jgi:hypothetical protein
VLALALKQQTSAEVALAMSALQTPGLALGGTTLNIVSNVKSQV